MSRKFCFFFNPYPPMLSVDLLCTQGCGIFRKSYRDLATQRTFKQTRVVRVWLSLLLRPQRENSFDNFPCKEIKSLLCTSLFRPWASCCLNPCPCLLLGVGPFWFVHKFLSAHITWVRIQWVIPLLVTAGATNPSSAGHVYFDEQVRLWYWMFRRCLTGKS